MSLYLFPFQGQEALAPVESYESLSLKFESFYSICNTQQPASKQKDRGTLLKPLGQVNLSTWNTQRLVLEALSAGHQCIT